MEEELASPRGEREQKVTADMLDKVRALLPASRLRCFVCAWRPAAHVALARQARHRKPAVCAASALDTPALLRSSHGAPPRAPGWR